STTERWVAPKLSPPHRTLPGSKPYASWVARWLGRAMAASDRLQDLFRGNVGRQDLAPVDLERQHLQGRAQRVVARSHAGRSAALLNRYHRLAQQPAHLDDRLIGWTKMLFAAVYDRPHALLDRAVLHVD